jgi:hypothetical protein
VGVGKGRYEGGKKGKLEEQGWERGIGMEGTKKREGVVRTKTGWEGAWAQGGEGIGKREEGDERGRETRGRETRGRETRRGMGR